MMLTVAGSEIPAPLSEMLCCAPGFAVFPALSVKMSEPLTVPALSGAKLMLIKQVFPAAKELVGDEFPAVGQVLELSATKLDDKLGLIPVDGTLKVRGAFPRLTSTTGCALLIAPTVVDGNTRAGGVTRSTANMRPLPVCAITRFPFASTAIAEG